MNQTRSGRRFGFFKKPARDLLPSQPVETVQILPWWTLNVGYITEDDMKVKIAFQTFTSLCEMPH